MHHLKDRFEQIGDVRGLGAICAMEIIKDNKVPDKETVGKIIQEANERGLLLLNAGVFGNVLRILMPLTITDDQLEEAVEVVFVKDAAVTLGR